MKTYRKYIKRHTGMMMSWKGRGDKSVYYGEMRFDYQNNGVLYTDIDRTIGRGRTFRFEIVVIQNLETYRYKMRFSHPDFLYHQCLTIQEVVKNIKTIVAYLRLIEGTNTKLTKETIESLLQP